MIPLGQPLPPGYCQHCRTECVPEDGRSIWPDRSDLWHKKLWRCETCDARVGSHEGTGEPFGTAANEELRRARRLLHTKLDPLWLTAPDHRDYVKAFKEARSEKAKKGMIADMRRAARNRVYAWLADRMGIEPERCHVGLFDIVDCRAAWRALVGVGYDEIRKWDHARKPKRRSPSKVRRDEERSAARAAARAGETEAPAA